MSLETKTIAEDYPSPSLSTQEFSPAAVTGKQEVSLQCLTAQSSSFTTAGMYKPLGISDKDNTSPSLSTQELLSAAVTGKQECLTAQSSSFTTAGMYKTLGISDCVTASSHDVPCYQFDQFNSFAKLNCAFGAKVGVTEDEIYPTVKSEQNSELIDQPMESTDSGRHLLMEHFASAVDGSDSLYGEFDKRRASAVDGSDSLYGEFDKRRASAVDGSDSLYGEFDMRQLRAVASVAPTHFTPSSSKLPADSRGFLPGDSHGLLPADSHGLLPADSHGLLPADSHGLASDSHGLASDSHGLASDVSLPLSHCPRPSLLTLGSASSPTSHLPTPTMSYSGNVSHTGRLEAHSILSGVAQEHSRSSVGDEDISESEAELDDGHCSPPVERINQETHRSRNAV